MKKIILLLSVMILASSISYASVLDSRYSEPLESKRVANGTVFMFSAEKVDLGPAVSYNYVVDPTVDTVLHVEVGAETAVKVIVYEDPTYTNGTTDTAYNTDRTSSKVATSIATLKSAVPTPSAWGTVIYKKIAQDGNVNTRIVLDKDSDYMITVYNLATSTGDITVGGHFNTNASRIK